MNCISFSTKCTTVSTIQCSAGIRVPSFNLGVDIRAKGAIKRIVDKVFQLSFIKTTEVGTNVQYNHTRERHLGNADDLDE